MGAGANKLYQTRIDMDAGQRQQLVGLLQASLADAVDLFTQIKQAHWNVKGPNFIALHELFDSIAEIVEEQGDMLAERITALGGQADGTARVVAGKSSIPEYPMEIQAGADHVAAVADRLAAFAASARHGIDAATELADAGTADLYTEISRETDKQLWFAEAHLQSSN